VGDTRGQESCWLPSSSGRDEVAEAGQSGDGVGNTADARLSQRRLGTVHESRAIQKLERSDSVVGDTDCRRQSPDVVAGGCSKEVGRGQGDLEPTDLGQTQPALGRDPDGPSRRLDYAELCITCDNRTDELRLLGNGVVPATAELAFKTLMAQLDAADS
jgi:hypothetical protein